MKTVEEIRAWRDKEHMRISSIVNPAERRYCEYTIFILNAILEEEDMKK